MYSSAYVHDTGIPMISNTETLRNTCVPSEYVNKGKKNVSN